jgi:proteic killer suppression protein
VIRRVEISKQAEKQLRKVPVQIVLALHAWVRDVETNGLEEARKVPGYHDEPLKGARSGQRSIRLNRQWRAIYVIKGGVAQFVSVEEVTPHKY